MKYDFNGKKKRWSSVVVGGVGESINGDVTCCISSGQNFYEKRKKKKLMF